MVKTLVITGASKGIGLATAKKFLSQGYRVINLSRSTPPLEHITHLTVDFTNTHWSKHVQTDLQNAIAGSESIALVHNVGLISNDSAVAIEPMKLRQTLEVNVVAAAILNDLLVADMPRSSSIIYIGSTLSEKAVANAASYVIAKHALIGLMKATCQDLAGRAIHTAAVCPGFTATEMLLEHVGKDAEILAAIAGGVTQNRLIDPDEIAETIYFCASNPVINGSVIHANLGQIER